MKRNTQPDLGQDESETITPTGSYTDINERNT